MSNINNFIKKSKKDLVELRKEILLVAKSGKEGHIASAFSILEIVYLIYSFPIIKNFRKTKSINRDRFILSKGHASLALYTVLFKLKIFSKKELYTYCQFNSKLGGHPDRSKSKYLEVSTGSLGHGLPLAAGMANSLLKKFKNSAPQVICLIGDQEANEGTTWESLLYVNSRNLHNLTIIIDSNNSGTRSLPYKNIKKLVSGFGIYVDQVDGHCIKSMYEKFLNHKKIKRPKILIANTIKGKGLKIMENNPEWHHKIPTTNQINEFFKDLK